MTISNVLYRDLSLKIFRSDDRHVRYAVAAVHGFGGDRESSAIRALAEALCEKGAMVAAFDFPAHGESPLGEDSLTTSVCVSHLLTAAAYLKETAPGASFGVFATSFGGYIALLASDELRALGFSLVLRAPAVGMENTLLTKILGMTAEEFKAVGTVETGFERKIALPYSFLCDLHEHPVMKRFASDGLVIWGDRDDVVPEDDIRRFLALNPQFRLHVVKGSDHRFKGPGQLAEAVAEAVGSLTA